MSTKQVECHSDSERHREETPPQTMPVVELDMCNRQPKCSAGPQLQVEHIVSRGTPVFNACKLHSVQASFGLG